MEKLGDFANMLKKYQPSLIGICATILSIVFLLLISCLAVVIDKAVQMAKARHQQELEDYFHDEYILINYNVHIIVWSSTKTMQPKTQFTILVLISLQPINFTSSICFPIMVIFQN